MSGEPPVVSRLFAGPFPALEEAVLSRLAARAAERPGRERILLVPSNDLREHLLRRLAGLGDLSAAGFSILTLYDFAVRLLKHRGLFPREATPARMAAALAAAIRDVYGGGEGDFAGISGTPGFLPALARTLSDLEEGWIGERELLEASRRARSLGGARRAARWAEWGRLYLAAERRIAGLGGMSRRRIFQEAVAGFEQPGYPFRVVLYGFYDFTRLQWTLVEALLSSGLLEEVYFPALVGEDGRLSGAFAYAATAWERISAAFEGNVEILSDPVPRPLAEVRGRLFAHGLPGTGEPAPVRILSAPHEDGEWRLGARAVRGWLDRHPGRDVVVVARRFDEAAASSWARMAEEYGIPAAERLSVPLSTVPPIRVFLQVIEAVTHDFPRRTVIDVLASPYRRLRSEGSAVTPRPDVWEVMTRELLVVSGNDWDRRLARVRPRRKGAGDGEEEAARDRGRSDQLGILRAEVRALRAAVKPLRDARRFGELAGRLLDLLRDEFRIVEDGSSEAERDRRALSALFSLLEDVGRIPEREVPWPGGDAALGWIAALLSEERLFIGKKGGMRVPGAVVAGDLVALRGVTADCVLFLSVNEDLVPAQLEEDPLLSDDERAELNRMTRQRGLPDALSLRRRNAAEEKLLFSLPAASARSEVAFGVLRSDAAGAVRRPSRYLLDLLSRFAGPEVFSEEWARISGAEVETLPRAPFGMLGGKGARSRRERLLASWLEGIPPGHSGDGVPWHRVAGTLAAWEARASGAALFPGPAPVRTAPTAVSASELDDLARCPYRFLLLHRLGLSPVEEPEEELSLTPAEMGTIAHEILSALGRDAAAGKGWGDPGPASKRAFDRFARENPTGLPGLYRILCAGIARDVAALVEWERGKTADAGAPRVEAVERPFELPAERFHPAFRGRVDRVDRTADGGVRIVDYKYRDGKRERAPLDLIAAGISNQIPVYLTYAASLAPAPRNVAASLLFLRDGVRVVTVDDGQWKAVREDWAAALSRWLALAAGAVFPPLPHHRFGFGGSAPPRYCDPCPFRDHCRVSPAFDGTEREADALVARVASDPALRVVADFRPARGV